jgi:hypothetical protein
LKPAGTGNTGAPELTNEDLHTRRSAERRARNESIFRDANEQIQSKARAFGLEDQRLPLLCECDSESCTTLVRLTLAEYDYVRAEPTRFVLAHGHDVPPDRIVDEQEGFVIVEKQGKEAPLVAERDSRRT